ncbi:MULTISPECIES: creatininase family protein [Halolamina]|uniref:Creatinine amidohydrolase n=1 Tax=Halolamina pelagica TaxID=699431 RepID=A0A1I5PRQ5_9EURY|nr:MULTISPECIES: creatininase family protein [Halolamina]NHX34929.1 creatininase family protein [Halolamina sp. R1-12]SFP36808.1 creatinine amidohydrolase [Halolamina pelagica]
MVDTTSSVAWAAKPYPEIAEIADREGSVLIVPVGALEQHGHHLPTGTDTVLVDAVATAGAERVSDEVPVLTTPPLWLGHSPHHLPFGGTVSAEFDTLSDTLSEIADSALGNAFDTVLFLNGHGGNRPLIAAATQRVGAEQPDTEVLGLTYFELGEYFLDDVRESDLGGMAHGGELETSMMLHLHPELVDEERMQATEWETEYEQAPGDLLGSGPLNVTLDVAEWSDSGAMGDVSAVSAAKGEAMFEGFVDELEALLRTVHE